MTNDYFLTQTVCAIRFLSDASPQQWISVRDHALNYVYCSPRLLEAMGLEEQDILHKTLHMSLYDHDEHLKKIIFEEDQLILTSRKPKMAIKIKRFTTGLTPLLCHKAPLINPATNEVVGILFQGFAMGNANLHQHILKNTSSWQKQATDNALLPKLTPREKQVIFLFMAHLSSQEIAEMLHQMEGKKIAKSTIDCVFNDQLYPKFEVHSRPALYKKLQKMGYDDRIPKELLNRHSVMLNVMEVY